MKGVMTTICPDARLIDLTHAIAPQDITSARFALLTAYAYLPPDSVHLVVVDPGVGTTRRAIAVQTSHSYFVAPDNGVLSGVLQQQSVTAAVALTNPAYWRHDPPSATFHGRDIFAPVAAHLANGEPLAHMGTAIRPDSLVQLPIAPPKLTPQGWQGQIQYIDTFGNLVTTVAAQWLEPGCQSVQVRGSSIPLGTTYADVEPGAAIALIGSHGWLEIAVRDGNAQTHLGLRIGDRVVLQR
jgi:S-adenosylmethionine hydrolase